MDVWAFVKAFASKDEVKKVKENLGFQVLVCRVQEGLQQKEAAVSYLGKQGSQEPEDSPAASQQQLPTWRGLVEPLLDSSSGEYQ